MAVFMFLEYTQDSILEQYGALNACRVYHVAFSKLIIAEVNQKSEKSWEDT